jgi:prephenate dehydrogenase
MQTIAIVGVGLIGGSFALALRRAGFAGRVLGVSSPESAAKASAAGVIDQSVTLAEACASADVLYLAHRISRILELIPQIAIHYRPGLLVTDAGSTKRRICETAARCLPSGSFLGGHPMAGKETRGIESADAQLFARRSYILTPLGETDEGLPAQREFRMWVERIGSKVTVMSPEDHDRTVAFTSHLPQFASTVLAQTVARALPEADARAAAGPGLLDTTRLALSSWEIWQDIVETNEDAIFDAIDHYVALLAGIQSGSTGTIRDAFFEGVHLATRIRWTSDSEVPSKNRTVPPKVPPKETP